MKIEKGEVKITLEPWELQLLQRFLDYSRRYANNKAGNTSILCTENYDTIQDFKVDFEKVAQKILDI